MNKLRYIICLVTILTGLHLYGQSSGGNYISSSALSAGEWYKIAVTSDGIYRINYETLKTLGLSYPSNPKLYSNNQGQLSFYNDNTYPDDLKEISIWISRGSDGVFNEGDYLLFFGQGTNRWKYNKSEGDFNFVKHNYSDTAFYFLTSGQAPGKMITNAPEPVLPVNYHSNSSDALFEHEFDIENLIHSGREWFQPVSASQEIIIDPGFRNLVMTEPVNYSLRVLARASGQTTFELSENGAILSNILVNGVNLASTTGTYAETADSEGSSLPQNSGPVYSLRYLNSGDLSAKAWLDYVRLRARKQNIYEGGVAFLCDANAIGPGNVTEFTIKSSFEGIYLWDISDPCNIKIIQYNKSGDNLIFRSPTDTLKTFAAFSDRDILSPIVYKSRVANQDLHSSGPVDMIILTHPLFLRQANELADYHRNKDRITSIVVTPSQIYNEFSGGVPDIAAIRNFARMKYVKQKGTGEHLKYLLLFGDGSFENKIPPPANPCFIPTYQSQNSTVYISSFTSDDFFGLLDDGEGEETGSEDIGIGRLPVADTAEASLMVAKIEAYLDHANTGDWKNHVCITADDEDNNEHQINAEGLSSLLADSVPWVNVDKIYFDAFQQLTTETGQFYPEVTQAINDRINAGTLIFNYVGHGNESSLGHERVVTMETIDKWANKWRLPLFITATCEFSRFDDVSIDNISGIMTGKNSAGEKILLSGSGGGIALMSTTRLVYSAPNYTLNRNILDAAFERDGQGRALCLGDIIRIAKNQTTGTSNKRNFLLLGDPAVRLAYPWNGKIVTDSVNDAVTGQICDTLKALSMVRVTGHFEDMRGNRVPGFNGTLLPVVYGKPVKVTTLANDGGPRMDFTMNNDILFSGRSTASEGDFTFEFMVPRDIDYTYGTGRISYYAFDGSSDMEGIYNKLIIGGFSNIHTSDTSGPEISLYMNDTLFKNGGITNSNPKLYAVITDPGGINTTGVGIGHDVVCWIDGDREHNHILNNYFTHDQGSYNRGTITYLLQGLAEGNHTITLKVWDNYNNSSEKSLGFLVRTNEQFMIKNLLNYPNPFLNSTSITLEHNKPDATMEITIEIFNLMGGLIRVIKTSEISSGYQLFPVVWDRTDSNGKKVAGGIYPYRVMIRMNDGETASVSGRMIIF